MKNIVSRFALLSALTGAMLGYGVTQVMHSQQAQMYSGVLGSSGSCEMGAAPGDMQALWQFVDCINATTVLADTCMSLGGSFSDTYDVMTYQWECVDTTPAPMDPAPADPAIPPSASLTMGGDKAPSNSAPVTDNDCSRYQNDPFAMPNSIVDCELCNQAGGMFDGWSCLCPAPFEMDASTNRCFEACPMNSTREPDGSCACMSGMKWNPGMNMCTVECIGGTPSWSNGMFCDCPAGYELNQTGNECLQVCPINSTRDPASQECTCFLGMEWNQEFEMCAVPCKNGSVDTSGMNCTCSPEDELIGNECVPSCTGNSVRDPATQTCLCTAGMEKNADGICAVPCKNGSVDPSGMECMCNPGDELIGNECMQACPTGATRDAASGECSCMPGQVVDNTGVTCVEAVTIHTGASSRTVDEDGNKYPGAGSVRSNRFINCVATLDTLGVEEGTCAEDVPIGSRVTLTATPSENFELSSWDSSWGSSFKCPCSSNPPNLECSFIATEETNCQAWFKRTDVVNFVVKSEDTAVTTMHGDIIERCGDETTSECTYVIPLNEDVTVQPFIPDTMEFSNWYGLRGESCPCEDGNADCSFSANDSYVCTLSLKEKELSKVSFKLINNYGAAVKVLHSGNINETCTDKLCSYDVVVGSNVSLAVAPPDGKEFWYWDHYESINSVEYCDCDKNTADCSFTMLREQDCKLILRNKPPAEVMLTVDNRGDIDTTVTISHSDNKIDTCTKDCDLTVETRKDITLKIAVPDGKKLDYWRGGCASTCRNNSTCTFQVTSNSYCDYTLFTPLN